MRFLAEAVPALNPKTNGGLCFFLVPPICVALRGLVLHTGAVRYGNSQASSKPPLLPIRGDSSIDRNITQQFHRIHRNYESHPKPWIYLEPFFLLYLLGHCKER